MSIASRRKAAQQASTNAQQRESAAPSDPNMPIDPSAPSAPVQPAVRVPFAIGTVHGHLMLIRRKKPKKGVSANLKRVWVVKCTACNSGEEFDCPEYYMKRQPNPKTHCGCLARSIRMDFNQEYRIWLMMHERCFNPEHMAYHNYGGRGIEVCMEWRRTKYGGPYGEDDLPAFEKFLKEIGPRPSKDYSVDRIDNDKGYQPGNVKWSTDWEQAQNRRK